MPQLQTNNATLHGNGAGISKYSAVEAILALRRAVVNDQNPNATAVVVSWKRKETTWAIACRG